MKPKRICILLLCLAMLFCIGCQDGEPTGEWGEFYNKDGYVHNTLVTAVLNTTELTAPVTELSYTLYENTDFGITVNYYNEGNDHRAHRLEVYQNNEWVEAPCTGDVTTNAGALDPTPDTDPAAHRKFDLTMDLHQHQNYAVVRYAPLQSGAYRLIVTYTLSTDDPNVEIPKRHHGYVLYFNVW